MGSEMCIRDRFSEIYEKAVKDPEALHEAPVKTYIRRPDEVRAARKAILRWLQD